MIKKYLSSSSLLFLNTLILRGFVFIVNVIVARYSSQEVYGQFSFLRSTINLVETTISSAINPQIIKEISLRLHDKEFHVLVLYIGVTFGLIIGVITALFSGQISQIVLREANSVLIYLSTILLVVTIVNGIFISIHVGVKKFSNVLLSSVISIIFILPGAFLLIENFSMLGAIISMVLFQTTDIFLKFRFIKSKLDYKGYIESLTLKMQKVVNVFSTSSLILLSASVVNALIFWWVRFFMVELPGGFSIIAKFDTAFQFILLEMLVLNTLASVLIPDLVLKENNDKDNIKRLVKFLLVAIIISFIMSITVYFLADYLIMIFGESFTSDVLKSMVFVPIVYSAALLCNRYMIVIDKPHSLFFVSLLSASFMLFYVLFYVKGELDIAIAFVLYYLVSFFVYQIYLISIYVNSK